MEKEIESTTPSNPRMANPDGIYASEARAEDYFSLRDHFAGLALTAIMPHTESHFEDIADRAYRMADYMLLSRERIIKR